MSNRMYRPHLTYSHQHSRQDHSNARIYYVDGPMTRAVAREWAERLAIKIGYDRARVAAHYESWILIVHPAR